MYETKGAPLGAQKVRLEPGVQGLLESPREKPVPQQGCPRSYPASLQADEMVCLLGAEKLLGLLSFAWTLGPEAALGAIQSLHPVILTSFSIQFPFSKPNLCFKAQFKHALLGSLSGVLWAVALGELIPCWALGTPSPPCTLPGAWPPRAVPGGTRE